MKKAVVFLLLAAAAVSCKSTSATSTKLDNKSERGLSGDWTLTSVSYPGSEYIRVFSFGLADSKCFEGSSWHFVSNNNKGTMALTSGANCAAFDSPITWFVNKEGQFVLKVLNAGEKARKVRDGYVLSMTNQTPTSFQLVDRVDVAGKMTDVVYQFQKR